MISPSARIFAVQEDGEDCVRFEFDGQGGTMTIDLPLDFAEAMADFVAKLVRAVREPGPAIPVTFTTKRPH